MPSTVPTFGQAAKVADRHWTVADHGDAPKEVLDNLLCGERYGQAANAEPRQNGRRIISPVTEGGCDREKQDRKLQNAGGTTECEKVWCLHCSAERSG